MKNTVVQGEYREGSATRELIQLLSQLRTFANGEYFAKTTLRTTDATVTEIWSDTMPTACVWQLEVKVLGYATDGNVGVYHRINRYKRGASGPAALLSTAALVTDYEDVVGWDVVVTPGADGALGVTVVGDAGRTVDWVAIVRVLQAPVQS